MSTTTAALEAAVAAVIDNLPKDGQPQTARQRVNGDRAFAHVIKLLGPRIRHFIRQYGLTGHWEDAEQCCAIGVHRAIQVYDPGKAQFTTFVNWQLRGELQSLRFRLMTDRRPSARKVAATTVSLNAMSVGADGETTSLEQLIEDEDALPQTEAAAGSYMATRTRDALLDAYIDQLRSVALDQIKRRARNRRSVQDHDPSLPRFRAGAAVIDPAELAEMESRLSQQRVAVTRRLNGENAEPSPGLDMVERERQRQVAKRAARTIAEIAATDPRFGGMFERPAPQRRRAACALADRHAPHNQLTRVIPILPDAIDAETGASEQAARAAKPRRVH